MNREFSMYKTYNLTKECIESGFYPGYIGFFLYRDNFDTWFYRVRPDSSLMYVVERDRTDIRTVGEFWKYIEYDDLSSWDKTEHMLTLEGALKIVNEDDYFNFLHI